MNTIQLELKKYKLKNQVIAKFSCEGCQGERREFHWIGKVIGFQYNKEEKHTEVVIEIIQHNLNGWDARDTKEKELYTYPLVNNDIQYVSGIWILFT